MKLKHALLTLALAPAAFGSELLERVRLPIDERGVKVATLAPIRYAHPPVLPQIVYVPPGSSAIASGTTTITGGTDTSPCFNDGGKMNCGDTGWAYNKTTDTLTVTNIGVTTFPGAVTFAAGGSPGTINFGTPASFGRIVSGYSGITPNQTLLTTGTTANALTIHEDGDFGFNFNNGRCLTSACTNPSLIIHSADQVTTEYTQISNNLTGGVGQIQTNLAEINIGGNKTAITEAGAVAIVRVSIPTSTNVYGATIFYTVYDVNGANYVGRTGSVKVQGGNSGGTATCTINTTQDQETEDGSQVVTSNAATLTYTWTNVVSTTNCDASINIASSEGANTVAITWTAIITGNSSSITATAQ